MTKRYPFGAPEVTKVHRGKLDVDPDRCTGCGVCEAVCPAFAVRMLPIGRRKIGEREVQVNRPVFDLYACISCGECVDACRFNALWLTPEFELATADKAALIMTKAYDRAK